MRPALEEQLLAIGVGREQGAVAWQREAERLGQAVHRVGGEHAGAGAAGGAGGALDLLDLGVGDLAVGGLDHGVDQVHGHDLVVPLDLARLHRPARYEHRRDVQAQRRHQHARA